LKPEEVAMIFAEMEYPQDYWDIHDELVRHVQAHFSQVESGHQSDSWIWITSGDEKVAIDTFTAMKHQVKSARPGPLVQDVLARWRPGTRCGSMPAPSRRRMNKTGWRDSSPGEAKRFSWGGSWCRFGHGIENYEE
jgi:hypothetical protein